MLDRVLPDTHGYEYVLLDCGPSLSLVNMNALTYADHLLVPVSCDYLSLVGVRQVMKTLERVRADLSHSIEVLGVLPTFYDLRNRASSEAIRVLKGRFGDKLLPPIRINTRLKEAPSHRKTIFEYDASSRGAQDYRQVVKWVVERRDGWLAVRGLAGAQA